MLALLPLVAGCVFVVQPPWGWFGGDDQLIETTIAGEGDAKVLLITISGFISAQPSSSAFGLVREPSTLQKVTARLQQAAEDEAIKALLLRINSPGGGVTASDEVYYRIRAFAEATGVPVVASLGALAASGGYYVACAADAILANPTTVTGSIGVILIGFNLAGLLDKLGIEGQVFKTGPHKDILSPLRGATPVERKIIASLLDQMFERFVGIVRTRRQDLDISKLKIITDGRVFSAPAALELGLIDAIGRVQDAAELAKQLAGIEQARVVVYHRPGATPKTYYAPPSASRPAAGLPTQVNILPIDLPLIDAGTPRFLYLWRPGGAP